MVHFVSQEWTDEAPDATGWCFEGFHTPNRKDAAYRKDADYYDSVDDKLESCVEKGCAITGHGRASKRARRR